MPSNPFSRIMAQDSQLPEWVQMGQGEQQPDFTSLIDKLNTRFRKPVSTKPNDTGDMAGGKAMMGGGDKSMGGGSL